MIKDQDKLDWLLKCRITYLSLSQT